MFRTEEKERRIIAIKCQSFTIRENIESLIYQLGLTPVGVSSYSALMDQYHSCGKSLKAAIYKVELPTERISLDSQLAAPQKIFDSLKRIKAIPLIAVYLSPLNPDTTLEDQLKSSGADAAICYPLTPQTLYNTLRTLGFEKLVRPKQ